MTVVDAGNEKPGLLVDTDRLMLGGHSRHQHPLVVGYYGQEMREERYVGRCRLCKRPMSALVPGVVRTRTRTDYGRQVTETWTEVYVRNMGDGILESWAMALECPECEKLSYVKRVNGVYNPNVGCNGKCMNATGPNCECECGGLNHGANHG